MKRLLRILFVAGLATGWAASLPALGTQEPREEPVSFVTEDGLTLKGTITGSGKDYLILSNQHHATEFLWFTLVADLASQGWAVLTYDYRGVGKSEGEESVPEFDRDLRAAHALAVSRGARRIVLVGASIGTVVSLKVAAELKPAAVVLLSALRSGFGLSLSPNPEEGVETPVLFVTSEYDTSRQETEGLAAEFGGQAELLVVPAGDHGTALFDGAYGDTVKERLSAFLKKIRTP